MFIGFLMEHLWLIGVLWMLVYLSDYYLTIYTARLFSTVLRDHIQHQGSYELTPVFQKDVNALRLFSPAFYTRLFASFIIIWLIGWLSGPVLGLPEFFFFALGGLFLREAAVHLRHIRNISLARSARVTGSLRGRLEYSRWLIYRTSAVDLLSYALFFMLVSLFMASWFFFGGAFFCAVTGLQHWLASRKFAPALPEIAPAKQSI